MQFQTKPLAHMLKSQPKKLQNSTEVSKSENYTKLKKSLQETKNPYKINIIYTYNKNEQVMYWRAYKARKYLLLTLFRDKVKK